MQLRVAPINKLHDLIKEMATKWCFTVIIVIACKFEINIKCFAICNTGILNFTATHASYIHNFMVFVS